MIKWRYKVTALYVSSGLKLRVCTKKLFFLFLNQSICCGNSKGTVSVRRFFLAPKTYVKLMSKKIFTILHSNVSLFDRIEIKMYPYIIPHRMAKIGVLAVLVAIASH